MIPIYGEAGTCSECPAEHDEAALKKGFTFRRSLMQWNFDMRSHAAHSIVCIVTSILMLIVFVTRAAAQTTNDVDLCNGKDRTSAEPQITGCTAIIKSKEKNSQVLAIAYNNRGNAYTSKGDTSSPSRTTTNRSKSIRITPNHSTIEA